ncbi:sensor histidine kinase [Streptomyces sp. NBC_01136]|uniref:sensor histidine kinase n=1 Tax=unclassified Streptomyces TaxID=2593676 RepID=UPI003254DAF3|nr:sensor histidine kinase [Streptomyces sp. NBC_01136]
MITSRQRFAQDHPRVIDATVVLLLFAAAALGSAWSSDEPTGQRIAWWPGMLLAGVGALALVCHRRYPRTVVAVTAAAANGASALGYLITPLLLAPLMAALYWLAVYTDRRTARIGLFGTAALLITTALISDPYHHPFSLKTVGPAFWVLMPIAWGTATRLRSAYLEAVQARAEYAERTREEEARQRVAEERMRIARELHDVVAHHLALANAQAGTAAHLARTHPQQVQKILDDLAGTTASALRELKATVGLLRQANDPDAPLEPSPGLDQLSELTAAFATAGLKVDVIAEGEPCPLSPGVDLTAFRIIQEALTNVAKHAASDTAHVRLVYSHNRLTITVTDDGASTVPTAPAPGHGFGLIGMRERALSVGGRLKADHRAEGGFEVTTDLPLHSPAPEQDRTS